MKIYHYDKETGIYLCDGYADPDPEVEGNWLFPAGATPLQPSGEIDGMDRVFKAGAWIYQDVPEIVPPEPEQRPPQPKPPELPAA
jgi:hypothetical protein